MSPKATPRTHASKTELLRVRNIRSQRHRVPVPPQNEGAHTRSLDEPKFQRLSIYVSVCTCASIRSLAALCCNCRISFCAVCSALLPASGMILIDLSPSQSSFSCIVSTGLPVMTVACLLKRNHTIVSKSDAEVPNRPYEAWRGSRAPLAGSGCLGAEREREMSFIETKRRGHLQNQTRGSR